MQERCFRLDPDRGVVPIAAEDVQPENGTYWVDLVDPSPGEPAGWLNRLGVAPSTVEWVSQLPVVPRVFEVGGMVLVEVPMLISPDDAVPQYVTMIATPHCLLTVHETESLFAQRHMERGPTSDALPSPTIAGLIAELVDISVEHGLTLSRQFRERLLQLQDLVDESPASLDIGEILEMKRLVGRVQAAIEDQVLCAESLAELQSSVLDVSAVRRRLVAGARSLDHLARRAERGQAQLDEVHRHASLAAQGIANRRLNALTIVQAIFVPLTLLAAIYGMNFVVLPELNWAPGYFALLTLMVLIAAGEMLYFWKRGWFD